MKREIWRSFDYWLFAVVLVLCVFGIVMITSALAGNLEVSVNSQVQYVVIGLFMIIGLTIFDYHYLDAMSGLLYFGIIVLLFALNIFSQAQFGAARWLRIGPFQLQPSEFTKAVLFRSVSYFFFILFNCSFI